MYRGESGLKTYSIGIVAENKALDSKHIEVIPIEALNLMDSELGSGTEAIKSSGIDGDGVPYQIEVQMGATLKAEWLGETNRMTAPDVRRGEQVRLYRQGDADKFYWESLGRNDELRRLETVLYRYSGLPDNNDESIDEDNSYYWEISTHGKTITLKTSKRNGEFCRYTLQFDTDAGQVILVDDVGNEIQLDSKNTLIHLKNADGSTVDLDKRDVNITAPDNINLKAGNQISIQAGQHVDIDAARVDIN